MAAGDCDGGGVACDLNFQAFGVLEAFDEGAQVALDGASGGGREDAHEAGVASSGEDAAELFQGLFGGSGACGEGVGGGDAEGLVFEFEGGVFAVGVADAGACFDFGGHVGGAQRFGLLGEFFALIGDQFPDFFAGEGAPAFFAEHVVDGVGVAFLRGLGVGLNGLFRRGDGGGGARGGEDREPALLRLWGKKIWKEAREEESPNKDTMIKKVTAAHAPEKK